MAIRKFDSNSTESDWKTLGLTLDDEITSIDVSEVLNTSFSITVTFDIDSEKGNSICENDIIVCPTNNVIDGQIYVDEPFRVKNIQKDLDTITIYAQHKCFDSQDNYIEKCSILGEPGSIAIGNILKAAQYEGEIKAEADVKTSADLELENINLMSALIGDDVSFKNNFDCDATFHNNTIRFVPERGIDRGVVIEYGKNLTGVNYELEFADTYTRILPSSSDGILLPEKYYDSPKINDYPHPIIRALSFSDIKLASPESGELLEYEFVSQEDTAVSLEIDFGYIDITDSHEVSLSSISLQDKEYKEEDGGEQELIKNGEFTEQLSNWEFNGVTAAAVRVEEKQIIIPVDGLTKESSKDCINVKQHNISIKKGKTYILKIEGGSTVYRKIGVIINSLNHAYINEIPFLGKAPEEDTSTDDTTKKDEEDESKNSLSEVHKAIRERCAKLFEEDKVDLPKVTISADLAVLTATEEYKDFTSEKIWVGDTVTVKYSKIGLVLSAKCLESHFDPIRKEVTSVVIGNEESSFTNSVSESLKSDNKLTNKVTNIINSNSPTVDTDKIIKAAVDQATEIINNGLGGYVVKTRDEILVMDTDDVNTAQVITRMNKNGVAVSTTGYGGPWYGLITGGKLVVDETTCSKLTASIIKAGILQSVDGSSWFNLENGSFSFGNGQLTFNGSDLTIKIDDKSLNDLLNSNFNIVLNKENITVTLDTNSFPVETLTIPITFKVLRENTTTETPCIINSVTPSAEVDAISYVIDNTTLTVNIDSSKRILGVSTIDLDVELEILDYILHKTITISTVLQGRDGQDGINGTDGISSYFHVKYAPNNHPTAEEMTEEVQEYIGTYVDNIAEDSNDPLKYTWVKLVGKDGTNGIPGINGTDGKTTYLHIKYSDDMVNFTANEGETPGKYMGQYTDFTEKDSLVFNDYVWSQIRGDNGKDGVNGTPGVSSYFHVKYSAIPNPTKPSDMSEEVNTYIGTYVDTIKADSNDPASYTWVKLIGSDGTNGTNGIPGKDGVDGRTTYLHIKYSDDMVKFTSNDGETPGKYMGQLVDFIEQDSMVFNDYTWSLIRGEDGRDGQDGINGTPGTSSYFHVKYAPNNNPTASEMTDTPQEYIGTYVDNNIQDSDDPGKYTWIKIQGQDGTSISIDYTVPELPTSGEIGKYYYVTATGFLWRYESTGWVSLGKIQGPQGIPGKNGTDGRTTYLHIKYSNDGGKTLTTNNGEDIGMYIGTYTDFIEEDSTDVTKYTWARLQGTDGINASYVKIVESARVFTKAKGATSYSPATISLTPEFTNCTLTRWQYSVNGGASWTTVTSGLNGLTLSNGVLTISNVSALYTNSVTSVSFKVTASDGSSDVTTIARLTDGTDGNNGHDGTNGTDGESATNIILGNENHTFQATSDGKAVAASITFDIDGYVGTVEKAVTIGTITNIPTGMNVTQTGSGTTNAKITVKVTTSMTTLNGMITIPVVCNGLTFNKQFTYSLSVPGKNGKDGINGTNGINGTSSYFHIKYSPVANPTASQMTEEVREYIGTYVDENPTDSNDPKKYKWSKFIGKDGNNGTNGLPGKDGVNGITYYLHVKYSNDGKTFTANNGETPGDYLGQLVDTKEEDSMIFGDYTWKKIKGEDGIDGKSAYFHIKYSAVPNPTSASQMSETPNTYIGTYVDQTPTDSDDPKKYTWTKFIGQDGNNGTNGLPGKDGKDGTTYYLHIKYSNDGKTFTANNGETPGNYLGQYVDTVEEDSNVFSKYTWTKIKGDKGDTGIQGPAGSSAYFHIKYSHVANPTTTAQMTETPDDYIGTYVDDNPVDSNDPKKYTWSRFKGQDGNKGEQGTPGINGKDGTTYYLHVKYSNDGKTFTANNGETPGAWLGQYVDTIEEDSTIFSKYKWTKIKGDDGASASYVRIEETSQVFLKPRGSSTFTPAVIKLNPVFTNSTFSKWQYSINNGSSWVNVTSGSNGLTINNNVLTISNTCNLFTASVKSLIFKVIGSNNTADIMTVIRIEDGNNGVTPNFNILPRTNQGATGWSWNMGAGGYTATESVEGGVRCVKLTRNNVAQSGWSVIRYSPINGEKFKANTKYTVSFEIKSSAPSTRCSLALSNSPGTSSLAHAIALGNIAEAEVWYKKVGVLTTVSSLSNLDLNAQMVYMTGLNSDVNVSHTIRNLKIEEGEVCTEWLPSVEELKGTSATTIQLSNENHTFQATSDGKAVAKTITVNVYGYSGTERTSCTVGTVTGLPNGMTVNISSNNTTNAQLTISVTNSMTTANGTLVIPITCNGVTFNKVFTYSLSVPGVNGTNASYVEAVASTQFFKCGANATTYTPSSITITPTFVNCAYSSWQYSIDGGNNWTNVSSGTNGLIISSNKLTIANNSALFTSSVTSIAFKVNASGNKSDIVTISRLKDGNNGTNGTNGIGISKVTNYYLATSAGSNVTTSTSGWTTTVQSISTSKRYLWNYEVITYTNNTTASTTPTIIGVCGTNGTNGANGKGIKSITEYYLATASNSNVTTATTGWTTTIQSVSNTKKYLWNYEVITYTDNTTDTGTPRIIGAYGDNGTNGKDSINVLLSNENHTFAADSSGKANATTVSTSVLGYVGTTKSKCTVGTITGLPVGMTSQINNNGTDNVLIAFTVTTALTQKSGIVTIPVTCGGVTVNKVFTYSLAVAGAAGATSRLLKINASTNVFKSIDGGITFSPSSISLSCSVQNCTFSKWQYTINGGSSWTDVVSGSNGLTLNGSTLTIAVTCSLYNTTVSAVTFRALSTTNNVFDTLTIYKLYDRADINNQLQKMQLTVTQSNSKWEAAFKNSNANNLFMNSDAQTGDTSNWLDNGGTLTVAKAHMFPFYGDTENYFRTSFPNGARYEHDIQLEPNTDYVYEGYIYSAYTMEGSATIPLTLWVWTGTTPKMDNTNTITIIDYRQSLVNGRYTKCYIHFRTNNVVEALYGRFFIYGFNTIQVIGFKKMSLKKGTVETEWTQHPNEVFTAKTTITEKGIAVKNGALSIQNNNNVTVWSADDDGNMVMRNGNFHVISKEGYEIASINQNNWMRIQGIHVFGNGECMQNRGAGARSLIIESDDGGSTYIDLNNGKASDVYGVRIMRENTTRELTLMCSRLTVQSPTQNSTQNIELRSNGGATFIDFSHDISSDYETRIITYQGDSKLHVVGGLVVDSGTKSAMQRTEHYGNRLMYAVEACQNYFEDIYECQLVNGECVVKMDEIFLECVNTEDYNYYITIDEWDECEGLFAPKAYRKADSFLIKEKHGGKSNIEFAVTVRARRRDFEEVRLEQIEDHKNFTIENDKVIDAEEISHLTNIDVQKSVDNSSETK